MSDDDFDDSTLGMMEGGGGLLGGLSEAKDDVVSLYDEAQAINKEIKEVKALAISLLERQEKVMQAIDRLKGLVGA